MEIRTIFFERYDALYRFYLLGYWRYVTDEAMCRRPHERVNSIAWNIWHLTRVEDAGVNRFVADRRQVLDEGGWMERLNLPWRHHGTGMTMPEVDEFNRRVDLGALRAYSRAVEERTRAVVSELDGETLREHMGEERLRQILITEALAHSQSEEFIKGYLGWSKAKCLFSFALTHSFLHLGEMEVLASMSGVEFGAPA